MEKKYAPFEIEAPFSWDWIFTFRDTSSTVKFDRPLKFSNRSKRIKTAKPPKEKNVNGKSFLQIQKEEKRKWK